MKLILTLKSKTMIEIIIVNLNENENSLLPHAQSDLQIVWLNFDQVI